MKKIILSIHMDLISTNASLENSIQTYQIVDKFLESYLKPKSMGATIFVIGEHLTLPKNAELVRKWSEESFEIANHTYTHPPHFQLLNELEVSREIKSTQEIIEKTIGMESIGFVAPLWAQNYTTNLILARNNFFYHCNYLPSVYSFLLHILISLIYLDIRVIRGYVKSKVLSSLYSLRGQENNNLGIKEIRMPTSSLLKIPLYQTTFIYFKSLRNRYFLRSNKFFKNEICNLTIHPADLVFLMDKNNKSNNLRLTRSPKQLEEVWDSFFHKILSTGIKTISYKEFLLKEV